MSSLPVQTGQAAPKGRGGRRARAVSPDRLLLLLVFVGVPFVGYALLVLWPFGQAAAYSLTSWSGFSPEKPFVGFDNFVTLFHDDRFRKSVTNTLIVVAVLPILTLLISYTLAVLLTIGGPSHGQVRGMRGTSFYRVVLFFPYIIPAVVVGLIWAQVFDPSRGLLNSLLTGIGVDSFESFAWLGEEKTARWVTIAVVAWAFVGFYMVLLVAAIRSIPNEIFEAARLDGASRFRIATSIIPPSVAGTMWTSYIYMGIVALDMFVFVAIFNPSGGPDYSTLAITQSIYSAGFSEGKFGLACAMGVVLSVMTFIFIGIVAAVRKLAGGTK